MLGFAWSQAYGSAVPTHHLAGLTLPGLFGPAGIIAVLSVYGLPLAYLAVTAGLAARADPALERAARAACANAWTTLRTVTLPLLRLPLLGAAALVFVTAGAASPCPRCSAPRPASPPCPRWSTPTWPPRPARPRSPS